MFYLNRNETYKSHRLFRIEMCKPSFSPLGYEHTLAYVLLVDPKAGVLNELFFLLAIVIVLRRVPKIIILIALAILYFALSCFFCRLISTVLNILNP